MKRRLVRLFVLICMVCALPVRAQQIFDFSALDKVISDELQQTRTPGAAVAVVLGQRLIFSKGFGMSDVETESPVKPEMLFRLGSTTKMFTATALVMLAEQGKINLNDPIGKYVAGLHPSIARITAHQLLTHTSGFFDEAPMVGSNDEDAFAKEVLSWKDDRFFTEPGAIYSYSNPGYWTVGFLAATIGGRKYADQMADTVFKPLGMTRTTLRPLVAMTYPLAQGHDVVNGRPVVVRPAANNAASWPAGSIFSNVNDLSRFVIAFMNDGQLDGRQTLPPNVIAKLQTPYAAIPGSDAKYGYGLNISTVQGMKVVEHGGSRSGYGSTIRMVPERKFGVIILGNRTGTSLTKTADKMMEIVLGLKPRPENVKPQSLTESDMAKLIGIYTQGPRSLEILKRDGKLFVKTDNQETPYESSRYVAVSATNGSIAFIHFGGRSWKKKS